MGKFEFAFNEIQPAIKIDPGNTVLYTLMGMTCLNIAFETGNEFYLTLAVENFLAAFEMSQQEQDKHNYFQSRKFAYLFRQHLNYEKKKRLEKFLINKNISGKQFLKSFYPEIEYEIPRHLICPITLVVLKRVDEKSSSDDFGNLL